MFPNLFCKRPTFSKFPEVFPPFSPFFRALATPRVLEALAIFEDLGDSRSEARATHLLAEAHPDTADTSGAVSLWESK